LTEAKVALVRQSFGGRYARRDQALFLLGVKSGFRISELLALRLGDVWPGARVVERVTVHRRHMKKQTEGRTILLHPEAQAAGPCPAATYVFRSRKGSNRSIRRRQALRVLREGYDANELTGPLGTHAMRKTFANHVYQYLCVRRAAGDAIDPFRLTSKALGHRSITSTDGYLSFLEADIDAAILGRYGGPTAVSGGPRSVRRTRSTYPCGCVGRASVAGSGET
jgi:integrase